MIDRKLVKTLRDTAKRFGSIYPIIMTEDGEVIDGRHRQQAGWDVVMKVPIRDRKDVIAARLVLNAARRDMPHEEKYALVNELAEILLSRGVEKRDLVDAIAKETGFTTRWVYKYLDRQYKEVIKPAKEENEQRSISQRPHIGE